MKSPWIVVMLHLVLVTGSSGCKKKKAEPATGSKAQVASKPLPGTESVQSLLKGVGTAATGSSGATKVALGDILASAGGPVGGGSLGTPLAGAGSSAGGGGTAPATASAKPVGGAPPPSLPPPATAGGDCAAVAKRLVDVLMAGALAQLAGDPEAMKQGEPIVRDTLASQQPAIEQACNQQSWPKELKDCLLTAADMAALQACERFATPQMRADAEATAKSAGTLPTPTTPPPTWSGGTNDCAAVGQHALALVEWQLSAAPPEIKNQAAAVIGQLRESVEAACTTGSWSEDTRTCVLRATSIDALNACNTGM